ncbi:MAG TPA: chorismate synthase [Bacteroidales bacterium]|nr:chorismate synthase [Bacteroidales bacterium]
MNTFGKIFRTSIFGESHGEVIGAILDGCPAGIEISPADFLSDLARRQSGNKGTTPRKEPDHPEIVTGVLNGHSTGAPITVITRNTNKISSDYDIFKNVPRPGHADFVAGKKYKGFSDMRGSGHFSGRITWGLVAAGVVAKKIISDSSVNARLISAGGSVNIEEAVSDAIEKDDSIGGIIECVIRKPPRFIGEPFFYSVESAISQIVFSIPAIKGIEFGAGFAAASMYGSQHNDAIIDVSGKTATNNAGGINGGIANGNDIVFRVVVKPTSSTGVEQKTLDINTGKLTSLKVKGRHDSCIALRIPVIVEAAAAIALADLTIIDKGINGMRD